MPTVDPTSAKTAAMREHTARPTMMMIPATTLLAKNSWLMPRKTALMTPSTLLADAVSAAERSVLLTDPAVTCASAGATSPPSRPLAKLIAPMRNISVMKLNASVNGGTLKAPRNDVGQRGVEDRGEERADDDPDHHEPVPVGLQEQRHAGADEHAVEAEQAGADRPAVHPDQQRGPGGDDEAERAREAQPRFADEHRDQDREPRDGVVHEADLADPAQAGVDEVEKRIVRRSLGPARHRPVDGQA